MSQFTLHTIEQAPKEAQTLLVEAQQKYGFVPNLLAGLAESPTTLQAYLELGAILNTSSLTPVEQQVVLLAASVENHCTYCVAAHSLIAKRMVKADTAIIEALRQQQPLPDTKLNALAEFTHAVVKKRGMVIGKDVDSFIAAGYNRTQVLEVILGVSMKTLSNYANHVMNLPLDSAFQTEAWQEPTCYKKSCN